jgi:hypothetical protein
VNYFRDHKEFRMELPGNCPLAPPPRCHVNTLLATPLPPGGSSSQQACWATAPLPPTMSHQHPPGHSGGPPRGTNLGAPQCAVQRCTAAAYTNLFKILLDCLGLIVYQYNGESLYIFPSLSRSDCCPVGQWTSCILLDCS